jgi:hypothetical protein
MVRYHILPPWPIRLITHRHAPPYAPPIYCVIKLPPLSAIKQNATTQNVVFDFTAFVVGCGDVSPLFSRLHLFLQQSSSIVGFICGSSSILYATHATQPPPPQMFGFCSHLNHLLLHYVAGGKKLTNELVAGL